MYECKYCNTKFTSLSKLNRHKKTAQYCLSLQAVEKQEYKCSCGKSYSRQDSLYRHQKQCSQSSTSNKSLKDPTLQDQITDLMKIITKLVEKPVGNTNINRNVMNLQPITDEEIVNHLQHLTINFIQDGGKGYANFAGCYPFKDRVVCTDRSRKKLKYKNNDGNIVNDGGGFILAQRFFQAIAPRNEELINAEYRALHEEVQKIAAAGEAADSNLTVLLTKASHLQELLIKSQEAARGENNELTKEFINHLTTIV